MSNRNFLLLLIGVFVLAVIAGFLLPERVATYGIIAVGLVVALLAAWLGIRHWRRGQSRR